MTNSKYTIVAAPWLDYIFLTLIIALAVSMWSISVVGVWGELNVATVTGSIVISIVISGCVSYWARFANFNISAVWLVMIFSAVQLSGIFSVALIPPFSGDEIAYSAALPRDYAAAGQIYYNADYGPYSAFPQNYEAITSASLILSGTPIYSKILNFWLAVGLAVAASVLSMYCGASRRVSVIAGLLVACSSTLLVCVPLAKNDIANAFFQVWSVVMLTSYFRDRSITSAALLAVVLGTSMGIKYNSLLFSLLTGLAFLWLTWTAGISYRERVNRMMVFVAILLIISTPWYLRNWLQFGNPFFPMANEVFNANNGFTSLYSKTLKELLYNQVPNFTWHTGTIYSFATKFMREFGYVVCVLGAVGAFFAIVYKRCKEERFVAIICIPLVALTLRFGFWEPRYVFVMLVLIATLSATLIDRINGHFFCNITSTLKITIFLSAVALTTTYGFYKGNQIYGAIKDDYQIEPESVFMGKHMPGWRVADYLNRTTPRGSKIAVGGYNNQNFYYLDRPYYHLHPMTEKGNLLGVKSSVDLLNLFKQQEISYVSYCKVPDYSPTTPLIHQFTESLENAIDGLVNQKKLQVVAVVDAVTIYKLVSN